MLRIRPIVIRLSAAVLLASTIAAHAAGSGKPADCQGGGAPLGSVELNVTNDILVPVSMNDQKGFMVLHTGAAFTVVWDQVVTQANLPVRQLKTDATIVWGRQHIMRWTEIQSFAIGDARMGTRGFMIVRDEAPEPTDPSAPRILGALGMDGFKGADFELDVAHRSLKLFRQTRCAHGPAHWAQPYASMPLHKGPLNTLSFPMEIEGKKVEAILATGQSATTLSTDVTRRLYHFDASSPEVRTETDTNGEVRTHYRAMKMTSPGLSVRDPYITLVEPPPAEANCVLDSWPGRSNGAGYKECFGYFPMELGRDVLGSLRLYFATRQQMLYVAAAD